MVSHAKLSSLMWRRSPEGDWERDIDECERFYTLSARKGAGCFPVTGCASFLISLSDDLMVNKEQHRVQEALRRGWISLRNKHPNLSSRIVHGKQSGQLRRVYSPFHDDDDERQWLDSTFKIIETDLDALQWFNHQGPFFDVPTIFLVSPKTGNIAHTSLFLRCPHSTTDGVGVLQLLDQLFNLAALQYNQVTQHILVDRNSEPFRLSPCLKVAASIPDSLPDVQARGLQEVQEQNGIVYSYESLLGLPISTQRECVASVNGAIMRLPLLLPRNTTDQVLCSCKIVAPGVSVTHVFMAALAIALSQMQPKREEPYTVRYVNHSMINLRPFCRPPYNTPDHASAAYHTVSAQALSINLIVPGSAIAGDNENMADALVRTAIDVRDFYKAVRPNCSEGIHEQVLWSSSTFRIFTPLPDSDAHMVTDPPFCPVTLSSIGNIASIVRGKHDPFVLNRVWASSEPIGAGVALFLGSWDGQIEISGVFDSKYHDPEYVEVFLGRIVDGVCTGLEIRQTSTGDGSSTEFT